MPQTEVTNLRFLNEAVMRITGSLDLKASLIDTFEFLSDHFPIDTISLHQFSIPLKRLKLLFLVQRGRFDFVETTAQVPAVDAEWLQLLERGHGEEITRANNDDGTVAAVHSQALAPWLPVARREYMVAHLRSREGVVGHLCFMGRSPGCFTEAHERKLRLLMHPFALAMANLLGHKRTIDFQQRLFAEQQQLRGDLELLRDTQIVGKTGGLKEVMETLRQLEGSELPALLLGETGTGKELLANAVQAISARRDAPFIKVNCGAIPDTLVDSEIFGYEKGAFTGATTSRPGRFEQADGGTLFLDEIGELPLPAQVRLLRVLQNSEVQRIGGTRSVTVDVRIIAATNRDLEEMMQRGTFRRDLYYRLCVFPIRIPPLRDRVEDIPELIHFFLERAAKKLGVKTRPDISRDTTVRLLRYKWPGNVRELENLVKRGLTVFADGPLRLDELLPRHEGWYVDTEKELVDAGAVPVWPGPEPVPGGDIEDLVDARVEAALQRHMAEIRREMGRTPQPAPEPPTIRPLDETIRDAISAALAAAHGRINGRGGAADLLGLNPSTLRSKMRKLGL